MSTYTTLLDQDPTDEDRRLHSSLQLIDALNDIPISSEKLDPQTSRQPAGYVQRMVCHASVVLNMVRDWTNGISPGQRLYATDHIQLSFAPGTTEHTDAHELHIWLKMLTNDSEQPARPASVVEIPLEDESRLGSLRRNAALVPERLVRSA